MSGSYKHNNSLIQLFITVAKSFILSAQDPDVAGLSRADVIKLYCLTLTCTFIVMSLAFVGDTRWSTLRESRGHIHNTLFSTYIINVPNKLECLSLVGFSSLSWCLRVRPEPTLEWSTFLVRHSRVGPWPYPQTLDLQSNLLGPFISYVKIKCCE